MAKAKYSEKLAINIDGFFTYNEDNIPVIQIEDAEDVELLKALEIFEDRKLAISVVTETEYI